MSAYHVEGWTVGSCVGFRNVVQRRTVVAEVMRLILDKGAGIVYIGRMAGPESYPIAQVSRAGTWQWQGPRKHHAALRAYVEETAS